MKKTITIEIEDKGLNVFYEEEGQPQKHWKDCTPLECVTIYAASEVLKRGTDFSAAYEASGLRKDVEHSLDSLKEIKRKMYKGKL